MRYTRRNTWYPILRRESSLTSAAVSMCTPQPVLHFAPRLCQGCPCPHKGKTERTRPVPLNGRRKRIVLLPSIIWRTQNKPVVLVYLSLPLAHEDRQTKQRAEKKNLR